jgi:hypothetical protein
MMIWPIGCHLEGLGGTERGVIGALAAVAIVVGGLCYLLMLSTIPHPPRPGAPSNCADQCLPKASAGCLPLTGINVRRLMPHIFILGALPEKRDVS